MGERAFLRQAAALEETSVGAYGGSSARLGRGDLAEAIAGIVGVGHATPPRF